MTESLIGNTQLISTVNRRLVLQAVRVMQPTYRAAVARHTGLKPATVTTIVNNLIDKQMLRETPDRSDPARTRWGRPPLMLEVNADVKRILAIDLEPERIRIALMNLLLDIVGYREQPIDRFAEPPEIFREIRRNCDAVMAGVKRRALHGVGVSLPGLIDAKRGILISSTNMPNWRNVPVAATLARELGSPVLVERSLRLAALYQKWSDPNIQDRTVLLVSVRTGIGVSLMHNGELYSGNLGFDGEIGHTVVDLEGPPCECGNRGCLETYIGAPAIVAQAHQELEAGRCKGLGRAMKRGEPLDPELIYRLARAGDSDCGKIVERIGTFLGIAVANLINLLAPHEVVICGSIDAAGEQVLAAMARQVQKSALPRARQNVVLRLAKQQDKLPLLGAAVLVAQDLFQLPRLRHGGLEPFVELPRRTAGVAP